MLKLFGALRVWRCLLVGLLLAGCSSVPTLPEHASLDALPPRAEIEGMPYFPQLQDQCGPAALATVLVYRGIGVTPDSLRPQVYLPGKGGSLAIELVARARRYGMLAYPLAPSLAALLTELSAGNPVLVMQNLGVDWWPQWHFAVAIGYDLERHTLLLRSGTEARYQVALGLFDKTWRRAERWAVVITPPERLPASAEPLPVLQAASELERVGQTAAARAAYGAALARWPGQPLAWMGLGNSAYALGEHSAARQHFLKAIALRPDLPAAWNNLGYSLLRLDCPQAATAAVRCAVSLAPHSTAYRASLEEIRAASDQPAGVASCRVPRCPKPLALPPYTGKALTAAPGSRP